MSGFEYRVPSQFTLSVAGNGQQQGYLAGVASMSYYLTGIDVQLIGPSAVAVASIVGTPTQNGGALGFHTQQGPAMPYIDEDFDPPQQCQVGATVGVFCPTPAVAGGTWNVHLYGFVGNPNF